MSYNRETLILREPTLQFGAWDNLDTLTASVDPRGAGFWTLGGDFGYIRMGTIEITIADTSVEYKSGTPHKRIRKDLLERMLTWKFTANQATIANFTKLYNLYVQSGLWNLGWIGADTPQRPYLGMLASGTLVDGTPQYAALWYGQVWTPENKYTASGTEYADFAVEIDAFVHPDFSTDPTDTSQDIKAYGAIFDQQSLS